MPSNIASNDLLQKRKTISKAALGTSSSRDLQLIVEQVSAIELPATARILDIGCGTGELLCELSQMGPSWKLVGMDLERFGEGSSLYEFIEHDLNCDFPKLEESFDLVIASHVILYLENPRHFIREIQALLKPGGRLIVNNPNLDGLRNIVSMALRGRPFCFSPRFPGHISAPGLFEMEQVLREAGSLAVESVRFTGQGRIPGLSMDWQTLLPFVKGKRFSDAYSILAVKVGE